MIALGLTLAACSGMPVEGPPPTMLPAPRPVLTRLPQPAEAVPPAESRRPEPVPPPLSACPPATETEASETAGSAAAAASGQSDPQALFDESLDFVQAAQAFWQKGELENALEALDHAFSLILRADGRDEPKFIQQKEDLRYLIAKRILEIHASRNIVVNGHHNAIPMVRNAHVDAEIARFKGPEREFFIASLKRSGRYREPIVKALREAGLPEALSWLPLIESGFKVNALSRARALGLWQFIPSTGYKFGLKRDTYIDERLDPQKATRAAIAYLKELHSIFGDWTTVLAAYNCGEGRVLRIIRSQNVNYLDNFWDLYERLPRETARYVPRFLATLHIVRHLADYGMDQVERDPLPAFETIAVSRRVHLKDVAHAIGVEQDVLRQLNPELRYRIVPGQGYVLRVPPGSGPPLLAALDQIPVTAKPQRSTARHRVRRGETLSTIARRYRTSVGRIMRANGLRSSDYIVAGRTLKIPTRHAPVAAAVSAGTGGKGGRHTVKSGDSLWILARRYGTTVRRIKAANNLVGSRLNIGQVLQIPSGRASAEGDKPLKVHRVRKGDTPFMIAKHYNMPLERLLRINRLTPRCKIYPGQRLYVD